MLISLRCCDSARRARMLLAQRRVTVDGCVETSVARRVTADFDIRLDGLPLLKPDGRLGMPYVLAYCKPCGVLCTLNDEHGRSDLSNVIPDEVRRRGLHPVGRLDQHSCGLLLFTTDGRLTRTLLEPDNAVPREYECVVSGRVSAHSLSRRLVDGVANRHGAPYVGRLLLARPLRDGERYEHASCQCSRGRDDGPLGRADAGREASDDGDGAAAGRAAGQLSVVRVQVREGKHRMVRRMLAHCGHPVLNLRRLAYGAVQLGGLLPGEVRVATEGEARWATSLLQHCNPSTSGPGDAAPTQRVRVRATLRCSVESCVELRVEFL